MPTTDVNISHRLSATGFDGRTSHQLQIGSTGDAQTDSDLHRDTQDLQVCLHPFEGASGSKVKVEMPESVPYSPGILDSFADEHRGRQAISISRGTAGSGQSYAGNSRRVDASDFLLPEFSLPNDLLPGVAGRPMDLSGSPRVLQSFSEIREIKDGDDGVIDRDPSVYGLSMYWFDLVDKECEFEVTEIAGDDLFEIGPAITVPNITWRPAGGGVEADFFAAYEKYGSSMVSGGGNPNWAIFEDPANPSPQTLMTGCWVPVDGEIQVANCLPSLLFEACVYASRTHTSAETVNAYNAFVEAGDGTYSADPMYYLYSLSQMWRGNQYPTINESGRSYYKSLGFTEPYPGSTFLTFPSNQGALWSVPFLEWAKSRIKFYVRHPVGFDVKSLEALCDVQMEQTQHTIVVPDPSKVYMGYYSYTLQATDPQGDRFSYEQRRPLLRRKSDGEPAQTTLDREGMELTVTATRRRYYDETISPTHHLFAKVGPNSNPYNLFDAFYNKHVNAWLASASSSAQYVGGSVQSQLPEPGTWLADSNFIGQDAAQRGIVDYDKRSGSTNFKMGYISSSGTVEPKPTYGDIPDDLQALVDEYNRFADDRWGQVSSTNFYGVPNNPHTLSYAARLAYGVRLKVDHEHRILCTDAEAVPGSRGVLATNSNLHEIFDTPIALGSMEPSEFILGGNPATGAFPDPALDTTLADAIDYNTWEFLDHGTTLLVPSNPLKVAFEVSGDATAQVVGVSWRANVSILTESNLASPNIRSVDPLHGSVVVAPYGQTYPPHSVFYNTWMVNLLNDVTYAPDSVATITDQETTETLVRESVTVPTDLKSVDFHYDDQALVDPYHDINKWTMIPGTNDAGVQVQQSWQNEVYGYTSDWAVYINAPEEDPYTNRSQITQTLWNDALAIFGAGDGGNATSGIARGVNSLGLLAHELGWKVEPTNAQKGLQEVPGSRWFDWKKMAMDLLPGDRPARVQARLDAGLYDDILTGPESMAAVFEAVDRVIREDYVDGANGFDSTGTSLLDEYYSRDAAVANAPGASDHSDLYTYEEVTQFLLDNEWYTTDIRLNTDYFRHWSNAGYGNVPDVVNSLREVAKGDNVGDLSDATYWSNLRVCSGDGAFEVACAWSLFYCIVNSCSDNSIRDSVVEKVQAAAGTFSGASSVNYQDGVELDYFNPPGGAVYFDGYPLGGTVGPFSYDEASDGVKKSAWARSRPPIVREYSQHGVQIPTAFETDFKNATTLAIGRATSFGGWVPDARNWCDHNLSLLDPLSGVSKTVTEVAAIPGVTTLYSEEQLADPYYFEPDHPSYYQPPPLAGYFVHGAWGGNRRNFHVGYSLRYGATIPDPSDWAVIADYCQRSYRDKPDTLTLQPTYEAMVFPKRANIPYGFNTLEDETTPVAGLTSQELGLLPARTLFTDTPGPTSRGETLHTTTESDILVPAAAGGGRIHTIVQDAPHVFADPIAHSRAEGPHWYAEDVAPIPGFQKSTAGYNVPWVGTDANGDPVSSELVMTIPFDNQSYLEYRDPALLAPNSFELNLTWADGEDRTPGGTWLAEGSPVFDGKSTVELFNRDKRRGVTVDGTPDRVTVSGPLVATEFPDDSVVVRKFKEHRDAVGASVAASGSFVLADATPDGVGGSYDSYSSAEHIMAIHPALHSTTGGSSLGTSTAGRELLVHPAKEHDFAYYQYEVSGQTRYMYPVYSTASEAEASDVDLGGDGVAIAYGVTGDAPQVLATQQDIDAFAGTVLYQTETNDTDVREVFNRHKLYSTQAAFRNGEGSSLLDDFFAGYPEVAAGGSHDPDDPVNSAVSTLTWNEIAAMLTDLQFGGDVDDPDPGRRMRYDSSESDLGLPSAPNQDYAQGALTPRGARLASKFRPGWMWGGNPTEDNWDMVDAYRRGLAREAAAVTSYSQVPEDNFYPIDDRYLAQFIPYEGVTTLRVTV